MNYSFFLTFLNVVICARLKALMCNTDKEDEIVRWHQICDKLISCEEIVLETLDRIEAASENVMNSSLHLYLTCNESISIQLYMKAATDFLGRLKACKNIYMAYKLPTETLKDFLTTENVYLSDIYSLIWRFKRIISLLETWEDINIESEFCFTLLINPMPVELIDYTNIMKSTIFILEGKSKLFKKYRKYLEKGIDLLENHECDERFEYVTRL